MMSTSTFCSFTFIRFTLFWSANTPKITMTPSAVLLGVLIIIGGALIVYQNPTPYTVNLAMLEVRSTEGILCISAFGLGLLTGITAMLTRDVPRMRRLRPIDDTGDS